MLTCLGAARGEAVTITLTFDDLEEIAFGLRAPDDIDFVITNSSGTTWTDFHLDSQGVGGYTVDDYSGPGTATYADPVNAFGTLISFSVNIVGLNVADGETLRFSQSAFCVGEACFLGMVGTARPTTDGAPPDDEQPPNGVPEPSSVVLLGTALGALGVGQRRRKTLLG
jgi:hypothetical protein